MTGAVLAILFVTLLSLARDSLYAQKKAGLESALRSFTPEEDPRFDKEEFHEAYPELSATVYGDGNRVVSSVGLLPLRCVEGEARHREVLQLGRFFKGQRVVIGLDLTETDRALGQLQGILALIWFPIVMLVGGATWFAAVSVFRPLKRLSAQALTMSGKDLSERLAIEDRAEFGVFARDLNRLLDRVEETVRRGERFSADAAHELRTPLAILRTRLETALLRQRTPEQYETTLRRSVAEIDRLTAITEALLLSSRGEAGPAPATNLNAHLADAQERWAERFEGRNIRLRTEPGPDLSVRILPQEVGVVLDNLLDNAMRFAPAGSLVTLAAERCGETVEVFVHDEGPGVPAELGEAIFDRFVRADDSRNRESGGAGIGLSVCRQIIEGRGGRMVLCTVVRGAAIGFSLPAAQSSSDGS